jgi:putative salt-induced outer membrane protein YdiY
MHEKGDDDSMSNIGHSIRVMQVTIATAVTWGIFGSGFAYAQAAAPPAPPPVWAGSLGAGLAITSGNADTNNFNVAFNVTHDPASPHVMKADALYLRGENEGVLAINRSTFGIRDDYALTERTSVFGQFRYLRDTFKLIDYLMAPTVGVSHKIITNAKTLLAADAGVGAVFEKNPGLGTSKSGAVTLGENFSYKVSDTATITQNVTGLWKTNDFSDALYTFGAGLAANITPKTTLKIELLEVFKNKPPNALVKKQDVSLITSLVYAF